MWKLVKDLGSGSWGGGPKRSLALLGWEGGAFFGVSPLRPLPPWAVNHLDSGDGQEHALGTLDSAHRRPSGPGPIGLHKPMLQIRKLRLGEEK